jgi:hypothetical protein
MDCAQLVEFFASLESGGEKLLPPVHVLIEDAKTLKISKKVVSGLAAKFVETDEPEESFEKVGHPKMYLATGEDSSATLRDDTLPTPPK